MGEQNGKVREGGRESGRERERARERGEKQRAGGRWRQIRRGRGRGLRTESGEVEVENAGEGDRKSGREMECGRRK